MKSLYTIFFSVLVSIMIGTLFMEVAQEEDTSEVVKKQEETVAFQVGAYKTLESAEEVSKLHDGIVIKENEYYLVYVGILSNTINIDRLIKILDDKGIYYYLKKIEISNEFKEELHKYEELMKETTSEIAYLKLIEQSLKKYKEYYEFQRSTN